jgi:hypothetical protein
MTKDNLIATIDEYLSNGGLFNPEFMDHKSVNRLLIDIRDYLKSLPNDNSFQIPIRPFHPVPDNPFTTACPVCHLNGANGLVCYNPKCPTKVTST